MASAAPNEDPNAPDKDPDRYIWSGAVIPERVKVYIEDMKVYSQEIMELIKRCEQEIILCMKARERLDDGRATELAKVAENTMIEAVDLAMFMGTRLMPAHLDSIDGFCFVMLLTPNSVNLAVIQRPGI
ncbi:MAG: hypothetical protein GY816_14090 [Cytophagales bacterium]|nr:hypothetical protein [Cytophagales bacterium]